MYARSKRLYDWMLDGSHDSHFEVLNRFLLEVGDTSSPYLIGSKDANISFFIFFQFCKKFVICVSDVFSVFLHLCHNF